MPKQIVTVKADESFAPAMAAAICEADSKSWTPVFNVKIGYHMDDFAQNKLSALLRSSAMD